MGHSMSHYPGKSCSQYCPCRKPLPERSTRRDAPTVPPTGSAEQEARAFETLIKRVGEGQARWSRLLELLESQEQGT